MIDPKYDMVALHANARHVLSIQTGDDEPSVPLYEDCGVLPETKWERDRQPVRQRMLILNGLLHICFRLESKEIVLKWFDQESLTDGLTKTESTYLDNETDEARIAIADQVEALYQLTWWYGIGIKLGSYPLFENFREGLEDLFPRIGCSTKPFGRRKSQPNVDPRASLTRNFNLYWEHRMRGRIDGIDIKEYVFRERARASAWLCYDVCWDNALNHLIGSVESH